MLNTERFGIGWVPMKEELHPKQRALAIKRIFSRYSEGRATISDHVDDKLTRRSHTGIILMMKSAIINWYSKKQNVVETSTFGAELIALRTALEMTEALVYKLAMLGVKVDDTPVILCDNSSVVINTSYPESLLKKKHLSIAYH